MPSIFLLSSVCMWQMIFGRDILLLRGGGRERAGWWHGEGLLGGAGRALRGRGPPVIALGPCRCNVRSGVGGDQALAVPAMAGHLRRAPAGGAPPPGSAPGGHPRQGWLTSPRVP